MLETFGNRLRAWRTAREISVYAVAKETGIPAPNLVSIEKGRRPASEDALKRLAAMAALDLTYDQLKGWQLLDSFSDEAIMEALRILYPEPETRRAMLSDLLRTAEPVVKPKKSPEVDSPIKPKRVSAKPKANPVS